jgi:uncharacterized protein YjdB
MADTADDTAPGEVAVLRLFVAEAALTLGVSARLVAVAEDAAGRVLPDRPFTWTSSEPGVVAVDGDGGVVALQLGAARVRVASGAVVAEAAIVVTRVGIVELGVQPRRSVICVGERLELGAVIKDQGGVSRTPRILEWVSSDPAVARVTQSGEVLPVCPGSVRITVSSGDFSAVSAVDVVPARVAKLVLSPLSLTLEPGGADQLRVEVTSPRGAPMPDIPVTWRSTDSNVVAVDANGGIRALAPGIAKITAKAVNASAVATVRVREQRRPSA